VSLDNAFALIDRHPARPQGEKVTMLLHGTLSQKDLGQPRKLLTALNH
jgi:hypothetical protein